MPVAAESFGMVLRRRRLASGLTQERLAEMAGVSAAGVASLEAGRSRFPRLTTVLLLADALSLEGADRSALIAAASPQFVEANSGDRPGRPTTDLSDPSVDPPSGGGPDPVVRFGQPGRWRTPFVGRFDMLARLRTAWEERSRVLVVAGEAGIGKTRLVDEFAGEAARNGASVLWGRWTSENLGPFAGFAVPLADAVRHLGDDPDSTSASLLPLLGAFPPSGSPGSVQTDSGVRRRLLFEAVAAVLGRLGRTALVLDDIQWADRESHSLLEYLATRPDLEDLTLVATLRTGYVDRGAGGFLADLDRVTSVRRVDLTGLSPEDIGELVHHVAGDASSVELVSRVAQTCEGNAFFAEELAEHLVATGTPAAGHDGVLLPRRVSDVLIRRIDSLTGPGRALMRAASVLGREFEPRLAGDLVGLDGEDLIAAGEDILLSGLVVETSPTTCAFSHALVQAAVEAQLSALRRTDLHRRAALALEESVASGSARVADLARHWAAVAQVDRSAVGPAATWAVRAGDEALAAAATDEAIQRYEQASRLWAASTAEHADTLIRLGTALFTCGRADEADARFRSALRLGEALADPVIIGRAALGFSRTLIFGAVDTERVDALTTALDQLGPADEVLRLSISAMLLRQLAFDRSPASMDRKARLRASVIGALEQGPPPDALLLTVGSVRDFVPLLEPAALKRLADQIVAVARRRQDLAVLANGWWAGAWAALERADREDWDACVAEYAKVSAELSLAVELSSAASMRCVTAQIEGRLDEARRYAEEAVTHARSIDDPTAEVLYLARVVLLGLDAGEAGELLAAMSALAGDYAAVATFQAGLCLTAAFAGELGLARRLLSEQAEAGFGTVSGDVEGLAVVAFYAHAAAIVEDRDHAPLLLSLLESAKPRAVRVGALTGWWGPVDFHIGCLCRILGRLDEAERRLESSLAIATAMRSAPFITRSTSELKALSR